MSYLVRDIEDAVTRRYNLSKADLRSQSRKRAIARPRQIVMYLSRELTKASFPQIARHLGGRHHTTIMHGRKCIARLLRDTNTMALEVEGVREILQKLTPHRKQIAMALRAATIPRLEAAE